MIRESVHPNDKVEGYVKTLSVVLDPNNKVGEAVSLSVDVYKKENGEAFHNIHLRANCYGTHCSTISMYNMPIESFMSACLEMSNALNLKLLVSPSEAKPDDQP